MEDRDPSTSETANLELIVRILEGGATPILAFEETAELLESPCAQQPRCDLSAPEQYQ